MPMREEMTGSGGRRKVGSGEGFPGHFQKVQARIVPTGKGSAELARRGRCGTSGGQQT